MKREQFDFIPTRNSRHPSQQESNFDQLEAMELYCANCGRAVPVRKSLLLVLPEGDKYEYRCHFCGAKVGDKIDHSGTFQGILKL